MKRGGNREAVAYRLRIQWMAVTVTAHKFQGEDEEKAQMEEGERKEQTRKMQSYFFCRMIHKAVGLTCVG